MVGIVIVIAVAVLCDLGWFCFMFGIEKRVLVGKKDKEFFRLPGGYVVDWVPSMCM